MSGAGPGQNTQGVQVTTFTGTPSSFEPVASPEALAQLEFPAALDCVAAFAVGPHGAARVRARRPVADGAWVRDELHRVRELADLLRGGDAFRPEPVSAIASALEVLAIPGGVLEGDALVHLRRLLEAMQITASELRRIGKEAPSVASLAVPLPPREVARALGDALEADGGVKDTASPELTRARRRVRETRARLIALLEAVLRSLAPQHAPADATVTVRGGRYVIPVLHESRGRVGGIVHGESGSGATLFVEPAAAVEPGNDLAGAEADEARAVHAVLRRLTDTLRPHREEIAGGWRMCVAVDDVYARARYAVEIGARVPALRPAPSALRLRDARHPLLLAQGGAVVPFDLELDHGETAVIISGPNTGGKTVLLKAVGLAAALTQAGVVPPVGEGTELPLFRGIFADIGDRQSISASLSTFSAHLAALNAVLAGADAASLVVLDELGSGTDPLEGGALAAAVLAALVGRGSLTVATTHLSQLKELATSTAGVVNASLRFDGESMRPTYQLVKGVPGRSYGLAIARRLGLPEDVLADAEARRPSAERSLDTLLAELEAKSAEVAAREQTAAEREESARAARDDLERLRSELAARAREIEDRERALERAGREQARHFLLQARKRVEEALALARAAVTEASAREARRLVEEGVQAESEAMTRLRQTAEQKGWTVRAGRSEGLAPRSRTPAQGPGSRPGAAGDVARGPVSRVPRTAVRSEVDLRGMSGDEVEGAVVRAVDDAVLADLPALRLIHGKGTGRLRLRVAEILQQDARVKAFRLAPPEQGGAGVTIAELA